MKLIACMSGTSLDGLDLVFCEFLEHNHHIDFNILESITYNYTPNWKERLANADSLSGLELSILDKDFGQLTGQFINQFIETCRIKGIDYIASHGHTVFHQPEQNLSLQIGSGVEIAQSTNLPVINDFRSLDVALNGQGAPLVPIGDRLLFSEYEYCLNLGGFSNVSFDKDGQRIAFDIAPVNLLLNYFAQKLGFEFDKNGELGEKGHIDHNLLETLNQLPFYKQAPPKSLGKEWLIETVFPIIPNALNPSDILRTLYEHIAIQIASVLTQKNSKTLVTGGGAFNTFLISRIRHYSTSDLIIPEQTIIEFKEALIFGLLGYLRVNKMVNVLKSVTGASRDSCSGTLIYP